MQQIETILSLKPQGVLSFTGGGGKTSLMFHLATLLILSGHRVLTTTTTRIFIPTPEQSDTVLVDSDPQVILRLASSCLKGSSHVTAAAAHLTDSGKLKGFEPEDIFLFEKSGLFDWILVEADGAAGRPLKAPAEHEPVIPSNTTVQVAVAGLEVLGQPLSEELVFRSARAGAHMELDAGEIITEAALARLFAHPYGAFKGTPPRARRLIFLNKADSAVRRDSGARVAAHLRQMDVPVAEALIVGQALETIRIHSVHSLTVTA